PIKSFDLEALAVLKSRQHRRAFQNDGVFSVEATSNGEYHQDGYNNWFYPDSWFEAEPTLCFGLSANHLRFETSDLRFEKAESITIANTFLEHAAVLANVNIALATEQH